MIEYVNEAVAVEERQYERDTEELNRQVEEAQRTLDSLAEENGY
ncbi:hypothetical protein [Qipengyuania citrea]|nr:hypothetical protein [Qipengyuania citrea]